MASPPDTAASSWSTEQLTGFLASITGALDEEAAVRIAVERAAEALDCEVGALVREGRVVTSVGFASGDVPEQLLVEAAVGGVTELELPGGHAAFAISLSLEDERGSSLVFARRQGDTFAPDEMILLRGMARVLGMTLTLIQTVESLRERQRLLEKSALIHGAITRRAPLQDVLDLIVAATGELLAGDVVSLRMVDHENTERTRIVACNAEPSDLLREVEHATVGEGVSGRAIAENRLIVAEDYPSAANARPELVKAGMNAAMSAPIQDQGRVIGALTVASYEKGREFSVSDRELLLAFAQHATLAMLDAKTVDGLLRKALQDPLTGLANRTLFLDRLQHALARVEREGSSVAVLFIDLDRFKDVNDNFGHASGDALLLQVAQRIASVTRATDTVARFGGDEFAVLLEDVDQPAAARVAAQLIDRFRQVFVIEGDDVFLSGSIGISMARRLGEDPIRDADLAMYRAKSGGRDRYEFFEAGMRAAMLERLELESDLKQALDRSGFVLKYQPIIDLQTGRVNGIEALARWYHPERGLLHPSAFIPLAEETGAIFAIGRWVLREACALAASWPVDPGTGVAPYVSVNLARVQLQQLDLVAEIEEILRLTGLEASRLALEITEEAFLDDNRAIQRLHSLKALGVRIILDDFGTGYSSLSYLQKFPLDGLKVAKRFVDHIDGDSDDAILARAIIELGHTLQLDVVAEGVERVEQYELLRSLGCESGQGYLFADPLDKHSARSLVEDHGVSLLPDGSDVPRTRSADDELSSTEPVESL